MSVLEQALLDQVTVNLAYTDAQTPTPHARSSR